MNICLTGSHGLIGSALLPQLRARGHNVTRLVRGWPLSGDERTWDFESDTDDDAGLPDNCEAVIHLGGEPVLGRWTSRKKIAIAHSRVASTQALVRAMQQMSTPPRLFLCASAIGFYGNGGNQWRDENSGAGCGFLADVCLEWEQAAREAEKLGVRVVNARFGIVLSKKGGALGAMLPAFRVGLGGPLGDGRQWWSWISIEDTVNALLHLVDNDQTGAFNIVAPTPLRNRDFAALLGRELGRATPLPAPATLLQLALGEAGQEMLLFSQRVRPQRLQESGFTWQHPDLETALRALL